MRLAAAAGRRTYLDELRQEAAHETVGVQPDPHLYARDPLRRLARRDDPPAALPAEDLHRKGVVRPLHHGLLTRAYFRSKRARTDGLLQKVLSCYCGRRPGGGGDGQRRGEAVLGVRSG